MAISALDDHGSRQPAGTMAGRPRRSTIQMTRTRVGVLRGTRTGALLATIALVALAARFLAKDIIVSGDPLATIAWFVLLTLVVWAIGVVRHRKLNPEHRSNRLTAPAIIAVLSVVALGACICSSVELASESGFLLGHPVAIGAACLGFGTLAITDLLLRTHPARHRRSTHDIAHWRPLASGDTSRTAATLSCLITLTLILTVALTPLWATRPIQQTAPEPAQIPAVPATVAGDLAWTLDLDTDHGIDTIAAGAAGPVVVAGGEIYGLDPADGSTRWTYGRPNAELLDLGISKDKIITGPNHRYAAFITVTGMSMYPQRGRDPELPVHRTLVTVLDTLTGRVAAERIFTRKSVGELRLIQLTDTAALIGTEAIDLPTGKTLWTLPEPETAGGFYNQATYVGPAGHSTFILLSNESGPSTTIDLTLIPQDDPDPRPDASGVSLDHVHRPLLVTDGWTLRYADETTNDEGGPAAAINIDEVAAAGDPDDIQGIDLGQTSGPDYELSRTSLVASELLTSDESSEPEDDLSEPEPATVFDPATRTANPIEQSAAVDVTEFNLSYDSRDPTSPYGLRLTTPDGSASSQVGITKKEYWHLANRYGASGGRLDVAFAAVPGAVLVHVEIYDSSRLYAIG
ncbi:Quinoprotein alcohol dehydrogenase-like superfamily [Propionibacterium ruminifibrarum]|uniref:Quinoprotein alcohol dehydrogenase-like superfamily n=1 Tax=Propionibacterium ruminifibrarum TaxID=1962131 RepID=A0A375I7L6_9ACTN|nr:hypothetical protein [Propionibacterium ruminifibrarum]SPF69437.1 Quinoprotein alcohol dehydrogenase-like superfamily [Propionibacterium ruminifibrarum]